MLNPSPAARRVLAVALVGAATASLTFAAYRTGTVERAPAEDAAASGTEMGAAPPGGASAPASGQGEATAAGAEATSATTAGTPGAGEGAAGTEVAAASRAGASASSAGPGEEGAVASEPPSEPSRTAPAFDLVRVEPDGSAAVAGTAEPGSRVTIYADAAPLAEARADADGNFVAIFNVEPSSAPRALTLVAEPPEGDAQTSADVVMLLPRAPEPAPVEVARADGPEAPDEEAGPNPSRRIPVAPDADAPPEVHIGAGPAAPADGEAAVEEPTPAAPEAPEVAVTAILRDDGVEIPPPPGDPTAARPVRLASISYTATGQVTLAGTGTAGANLRAYVDDDFAQEVRIAADGRWRMDLDDVAGGLYRLRIDQISDSGRVASRVETPFQRDFPAPPRPRPGQPGPVEPGAAAVTVQPGNNLWTLAQERYGSGVFYTQIYTANRELIRDPNLIYPGQIFNLPASGATE